MRSTTAPRRRTPSGSPCWPTRPGSGCCTRSPPRRTGSIKVGDLATLLGISQSTCSHHVRKLADVGFVAVDKVGTASIVSVNPACCTGLPHAADVVMGTLATMPCCPEDLPADVSTRALDRRRPGRGARHLRRGRRHPQRHLRDRGTDGAEARGEVAARAPLGRRARRHGRGLGRDAAPVSSRECYAGVAETSVYVTETARGRGVGKALLHRQVTEADRNGLWTLQTSIFPENRASIALHHSAGYRDARRAPAHRPARRRLARHGAARAAPGGLTCRRVLWCGGSSGCLRTTSVTTTA